MYLSNFTYKNSLWKNDNIFIESKKCYNINNYANYLPRHKIKSCC